MTTRIAAFGCAHLGYHTPVRTMNPDGTNPIQTDGYRAHLTVMHAIADTPNVDLVIDAGDLFHTPRPTPKDIGVALEADALRTPDGGGVIPRLSIPGNHDRTGATATPATIALSQREALAVIAPGVDNAAKADLGELFHSAPVPGYYEIYKLTGANGSPDVLVHMVNEQALAPQLANMDIRISPFPVEQDTPTVNLLVTHGIVPKNGTVLYHHTSDERGGERVIPLDWFTRGFDYAILADFHTPTAGVIDGADTPYIYLGSLIRRGWADEDTPRGWAEIVIDDEGGVDFEFHAIDQRPTDEIVIDAEDADLSEVIEAVETAIGELQPVDHDLEPDLAAARLRVTVRGVNRSLAAGLVDKRKVWATAHPDALDMTINIVYADMPEAVDAAEIIENLPDFGRETLEEACRRMAEEGQLPSLNKLDGEQREQVIDEGIAALAAAEK